MIHPLYTLLVLALVLRPQVLECEEFEVLSDWEVV